MPAISETQTSINDAGCAWGKAALLFLVVGGLLMLNSCDVSSPESREAPRSGVFVPVTFLPLDSALDEAELSGLAWYGNWLVLLPQNPGQFAPPKARFGEGRVFALHRDSILAALDARMKDFGEQVRPLQPRGVPLLAPDVASATSDFDGYEALALRGDTAFVAIEAGHSAKSMQGFVAEGRVSGDLDTLRLNAATVTALPVQAAIDNLSYEALVAGPHDLLALYESNGATRVPRSRAARLTKDLQPLPTLLFPRLEYRVTDATSLDTQVRFWVVNYYWPGDSTRLHPNPNQDMLSLPAPAHGPHSSNGRPIERLVEFQRTGDTISMSGRAPIRLQLDASGRARNWEGIARLAKRGFLLVTDEYPRTLLGVVPNSIPGAGTRGVNIQSERPPSTWAPAWLDPAETVFAVLAGLALAVLGLLAARHPRAAQRLTRERFRTGTAYGLSLTAAVVLVGGAFWAFTEVIEAWTQQADLYRLDAAASRIVQTWAMPWLDVAMRYVTWLGSGWATSLIVGFVAVRLYQKHARRSLAVLMVGLGAGETLVYGLKSLFHRARPKGGLTALGASFPSGHAFTAMVTYGLLAYLLWRVPPLRRWRHAGTALFAVIILLVGVSRIYLRAHYLTDVAGGFVLGLGWLAAAVTLTNVLRERVGQP